MVPPPRLRNVVPVATIALFSASCRNEAPSVPTQIVVSPSVSSVEVSQTQAFSAKILDDHGGELPDKVTWRSSDAGRAVIDDQGIVKGMAPGEVVIEARFQDLTGAAVLNVTDTTPPTVSIVEPTPGSTLRGTATVQVGAGDNHAIGYVVLLVDGAAGDTLRQGPWEFSWSTLGVSNGGHSLRVTAADASGNVGTSAVVQVTVANAHWEALAPLPYAVRAAAVATDGEKVYVVGGYGVTGRMSVFQILDLATGTWRLGPSLPSATDWGTAAWVNGAVHFIGGNTDGLGTTDRHLVYRPGSTVWKDAARPPRKIAGTASVAVGSRIYLFAGNIGQPQVYTKTTLIYDAEGDAWSPGEDVPSPRINWAGALLNDEIFLVGGGTPGLNTSADFFIYSLDTGSWQAGPPIPVAREAHGVGAVGGRICAVGGRRAAAGGSNVPFDDVLCFDVATQEWLPGPQLPRAVQEVNVISLTDAIVAVGGADENGQPVGDVSIFRADPVAPAHSH